MGYCRSILPACLVVVCWPGAPSQSLSLSPRTKLSGSGRALHPAGYPPAGGVPREIPLVDLVGAVNVDYFHWSIVNGECCGKLESW